MKIFVYNYRDDEAEFFDEYSKKYGAEIGFTKDYPSMENAELVKGYEGLSIIVSNMNAEILQKFHDFGKKYITSRSVGFEHFDLAKAKELGLRFSTVAYSSNSVANYAIMLMLMSCRKVKNIIDRHAVQDFTLEGKRGIEISESTIGIIGTGKIGKTVIEHLSGFGCKMLAYDIYPNEKVKKHAAYVDLDTLLRQADIITFHTPSTPENYHLLNDEALAKMKDGAIAVNIARGTLIDTEVLIRGLESGKVGAAALDVLENEFGLYYLNLAAKVINNREMAVLKSFPNVILTPHTAFYTDTDQAVSDMVENAIRGCCLFKEGKGNPFEVA
jgi:lactate dehydrogenase-like 2-hydroxyacid dehydrogenase